MGYRTQTQPRQVHPKSGKLEFKIVYRVSLFWERSSTRITAGTLQLRRTGQVRDGDGLRPAEGGRGVCKLSSSGLCPWCGLTPVPSPMTGVYRAGQDPWSPCVHVPLAAGHQGSMRSWSDPSPSCIQELGTSRKKTGAGDLQEKGTGGMLLAGLVVGGDSRRGGLVLGVAGPGGAPSAVSAGFWQL